MQEGQTQTDVISGEIVRILCSQYTLLSVCNLISGLNVQSFILKSVSQVYHVAGKYNNMLLFILV